MPSTTLHTLTTLLAIGYSVVAMPATTTTTASFAFSQWIEDIIADPTGNHLSPEEAVSAKKAAASTVLDMLEKRAWCQDGVWPAANVCTDT
jgi:hypothetical protein